MPDSSRSANSATGHSSPLPHQRDDDQQQSASTSDNRVLQRNAGLQRSSTVDIPHDRPQNYANLPPQPASDQGHARQADLNYSHNYGSFSRPTSRGGPSPHSDENRTGNSFRSTNNSTSNVSQTSSNNSSPVASPSVQPCSACGLAMSGQFVRALGSVYHLDCFRCKDCNTVVAQKFFPIEGQDGKQYPLCERDYFKRLNLICANCGMALRASYITACGKKYHVEHFTCSVCPTLFGPQDSYYEHEGNVYCHFHYSTRFATKCVGCGIAILKQFVEINRNMRDECWHPECYMIHKFWSVKLSNKRVDSFSADTSQVPQEPRASYEQEEQGETAESLKVKQVKMEKQVYRIWTVLSAFEESSAACISDMLRHVSNGHYLEAVRMAERFILHVEVLFATIDDLETHFARLSPKGMAHVREARMLCRKTVDLFTLLSHTQETGERRVGMTQEMLALVTGLAHYLKILIRIALTGALKLERDYSFGKGLVSFLDHLQALATNKGNPAARRIKAESVSSPDGGCPSTQGVSYGYKSLSPENAGESPFDGSSKPLPPPSDLCMSCRQTVEEDCVRLGTYRRWHSACVKCASCGKVAAVPLPPKEPNPVKDEDEKEGKVVSKAANTRRPPPLVNEFVFEPTPLREGAPTTEVSVACIYCLDHAHAGCERGFLAVTRLEQYAFLLSVALRRLYIVLRRKGVIPMSAAAAAANQGTEPPGFGSDAYRNSSDAMRINSTVALDRKLSATFRVPRRSTIVESPSGKTVQAGDTSLHPQRIQGQPELHNQRQVIPTVSNTPPTPSTPTLRQPQPRSATTNTPLLQPRSPTTSPAPWQDHTSSLGSPAASEDYRPSFARHNTQVKVVKDPSAPTSPAQEQSSGTLDSVDPLAAMMLGGVPDLAKYQRPLLGNLTPLELTIIKHVAVLSLAKSPLRDQFDLEEILDMVEAKKAGWWGKLFRGGAERKKKTGVFGVPLEQLVDRQGTDSVLGAATTVAGATLRIPSIVDDLISAMRQMDMSVEGIFRKNGNIRRLNKLAEAVDQDPAVDLTQESAVQLAVLLKKFLRELPEPLLTFKLYNLFVASQKLPNQQDRQRYLHYASIILPKPNRDTLEVLFVFLKWVASFAHVDEETGSKMDLQNLATVICPNILYSSKNRDAVHAESVIAIPVVTELLVYQDEYWQVPEEFVPLLQDQEFFANCLELPSKEFLKRCEQYYRIKLSGRQPTPHMGGGLMSPILQNPNGNTAPLPTPQPWSDNDVRLVPQRSDPAMPRGRPPTNDLHSSNPNRYKPDSQSLERGSQQRDWPSGSPSKGGQLSSQHPGMPSQPYSQAAAAPSNSPPEKLMSNAEWAAAQRPPPPISTGQGRTRSGSRPGSFIKTNDEVSPSSSSANGRYSPPRPGLSQ